MSLVLKRILDTKDLDAWSKLKRHHFKSPWTDIFTLIARHYEDYGRIPNVQELELTVRDKHYKNLISTLRLVEVPEVETDLLVDATINDYAQTEALGAIDKMLDKIALMDATEIVQHLNDIALNVESKTVSPESEVLINQVDTLKDESSVRVDLGICNDFDQATGGLMGGTYLMYGGYRGTGKSVIGMAMVNHQLDLCNSSLFFSVEMSAKESFDRLVAMRAGVNHSNLTKGQLTESELDKVVKTKSAMAENEYDLLKLWDKSNSFEEWEKEFASSQLKSSQCVVIHDSNLTTTAIDAQIAKYKSKFGDKLKLVVVDYLNELNDFEDTYDWKPQIQVSKRLKKIATKYDIVLVSPYQTDEKGGVRFSKGIEIPADMSYLLEKDDAKKTIKFINTKVRGMQPFHFEVAIDWPKLKIDPSMNYFETEEPEEPKPQKTPTRDKSEDDLSLF